MLPYQYHYEHTIIILDLSYGLFVLLTAEGTSSLGRCYKPYNTQLWNNLLFWEDKHQKKGTSPHSWTRYGTAHPTIKSPKTRADLPVSSNGGADTMHPLQTATWFVSHTYFRLELA